MTGDPFGLPSRCPECRATDGHYIGCSIMEDEHERRRGVCPRCRLVRPCQHSEDAR